MWFRNSWVSVDTGDILIFHWNGKEKWNPENKPELAYSENYWKLVSLRIK